MSGKNWGSMHQFQSYFLCTGFFLFLRQRNKQIWGLSFTNISFEQIIKIGLQKIFATGLDAYCDVYRAWEAYDSRRCCALSMTCHTWCSHPRTHYAGSAWRRRRRRGPPAAAPALETSAPRRRPLLGSLRTFAGKREWDIERFAMKRDDCFWIRMEGKRRWLFQGDLKLWFLV